jgi:hypothetical protein
MSFSVADFQSAVDKINDGMDDISAKMDELPQKANNAIDHWYIPDFIADAVVWMVEKMQELAQKIWDKLVEFLKGVVAPIYFWDHRSQLQNVVDRSNDVVARLGDAELAGSAQWEGLGADAYRRQIGPQRAAAGELSAQAEGFRGSLLGLAIGGLAFYVGVGVIVVKFVVALVACLVALGSVVFSWAGLAIVCEEAGVNTAALAALAVGLGALLEEQVRQMAAMQDSLSSDTFPGGVWPQGHNGQFSDGTVKDGDNDWSLGG